MKDFRGLFASAATVTELKKLYRKHAMENHPDRGGDTATMQAINAAYTDAFEILRNRENKEGEGKEGFRPNRERPRAFTELMEMLLGLHGLTIDIVGTWVWVSGKTYENKDALKAAGFRWSKSKKMWYWFDGIKDSKKKTGSRKTYQQITNQYGLDRVKSKGLPALPGK